MLREIQGSAGLLEPRHDAKLCRTGAEDTRLRRLPAVAAGACQRRPRRHHDAQPPAIPDRHLRHPARRHDRGQRQSAVHAARAGTSAEGLRRQGHRHRRELRHHPAAGDQGDPGRACDHHPDRRPAAGAEALDRQLRDQERQEDGAGLAH